MTHANETMPSYDLTFKPAIGLYGQHDPSAALFADGELLFAVEEERLTRQKHATHTFPDRAIRACLDYRDLELGDIDRVRLPYDPSLRANILGHYLRRVFADSGPVRTAYRLQRQVVREAKAQFDPVRRIERRLGSLGDVPPIENLSHHACHAASAFHPSGFEDALVLTVDAKGEYDSTVVWHGTPDGLERVRTYDHPNSLGLFFAAITEYLGYRMFNGEGKVMGLAPYGERDPSVEQKLRSVVEMGVDYDVTDLVEEFNARLATERLADLFGRPGRETPGEFTQFEKNLAHVAQRLLEETVVDIVETYCRRFGTRNVALAGGVVLNCKMNQTVVESPAVDDVFVQPVAHDAGLALGAGWLGRAPSDVPEFTHVYWGPEHDTDEIRRLLDTNKLDYREPADLERAVAERLADGELVGWFQGRLELPARTRPAGARPPEHPRRSTYERLSRPGEPVREVPRGVASLRSLDTRGSGERLSDDRADRPVHDHDGGRGRRESRRDSGGPPPRRRDDPSTGRQRRDCAPLPPAHRGVRRHHRRPGGAQHVLQRSRRTHRQYADRSDQGLLRDGARRARSRRLRSRKMTDRLTRPGGRYTSTGSNCSTSRAIVSCSKYSSSMPTITTLRRQTVAKTCGSASYR